MMASEPGQRGDALGMSPHCYDGRIGGRRIARAEQLQEQSSMHTDFV
jgi:hypothetical protein